MRRSWMGKGLRLVLIALGILCAQAVLASAGRSIPKGEEFPSVIEKVFASPFGEVQFIVTRAQHSAFLRNSRGNLLSFQEIYGEAACEEWLVSAKGAPVPSDCEFVFYNDAEGTYQSVRSGEMTETDLFQTMRGKLRGWRNYVAL